MMLKMILFLLSIVPLGFHVPYLLQAWSSSRLDKLDWLFYLLAVAAAVRACHSVKMGKCDFYALFLLIPVLSTNIPLDAFNELLAQSTLAPIFNSNGFFASVIAGKL